MRAQISNGCPFVPVEAFLYEGDERDLPSLDHCRVRATRGMAIASTAPRAARPSSKLSESALLREVFGQSTTRDDLSEAFSARTHDGVHVRAEVVRAWTTGKQSGVLDLGVEFRVLIDGAPNVSGVMARNFYRDAKGVLTASHEVFDLGMKFTKTMGQGIGAAVTKKSLLWEKRVGVSRVDLNASWVGRYVWATFGWNWSADEAAKKREELWRYVKGRRNRVFTLEGKSFLGSFHVDDMDDFKVVVEGLSRRAWDVASLVMNDGMGGTVHVGKTFLAGILDERKPGSYRVTESGAESWEGSLVLRDGHPTWERCKHRLGI